jgi:hypothetical protein
MPKVGARCARSPGHGSYHHPGVPCTGGCGRLVSTYSGSTGLCRECYTSRICAGCSRSLYARNKTDLCTPCKSRISERIRRVRLSQIKLATGCVDCGFREHPDALVFSHVRGENRRSVALLYSGVWSRVLEEIAKCDVICANCHAIRWAHQMRDRFQGHQNGRSSAGYRARRAAVARVKLAAGCADCGYQEHAEALQFDHVEGEKVAGIGRMTGAASRDLTDEIAKCAVRCANCHAIRTAELAGWDRTATGDWQGVSDSIRAWALGRAREIGLADDLAVAAAVANGRSR